MGKDSDYGTPGHMLTGKEGPLTVGDIRNSLHGLDADVEVTFGSTEAGMYLEFYRFKWRGDDLLQIELNEVHPNDPNRKTQR